MQDPPHESLSRDRPAPFGPGRGDAHGTDRTPRRGRSDAERQRAEEEIHRLATELARRVEEMEALLRVIPVGIGIAHDPRGEYITVNPAFAALLGIAPGENASVSRPDRQALPFRLLRDGHEVAPDELPLQFAALHGVLVPGVELDVVRADGTTVTLWETAAPLLDEHGRSRGSVGAFVDVTERRRAEAERERLLAAERSARARMEILQAVTAALSSALTEQDIIHAVMAHGLTALRARSTALVAVADDGTMADQVHAIGWPAEGLARFRQRSASTSALVLDAIRCGDVLFMSSVEEYIARYPELADLRHMLGGGACAAVPLLAKRRVLGVLAIVFAESRPWNEEDHAFLTTLGHLAGQALERSRLYEAERAARADAEQANRAKTEFLARMSHELRTPLNAIRGYAELMEMGVHGPVTAAQRESLTRIARSERHLLALVNDLLDVARIESGRVEFHLRPVSLVSAVEGVTPVIVPQFEDAGMRLEIVAGEPGLAALADPDRLRQILANLLSNAAKFSFRGDAVRIVCGADERTVWLRVEDRGRGIPPEHLETIFQPFTRLGEGVGRGERGVGLGLAISRELARGMGGDLGVESAPGTGSAFTLRLPRAAGGLTSLREVQ